MLNDEMMKPEGAPLDMLLLLFLCKILVKINLSLSLTLSPSFPACTALFISRWVGGYDCVFLLVFGKMISADSTKLKHHYDSRQVFLRQV